MNHPAGELRGLTGMRGIAAWFVVLYHIHLSIAALSPGWVAVFAKGNPRAVGPAVSRSC